MTDRTRISIWDPGIVSGAVVDSFRKLDPRVQVKNPVMFIVEVGSLVTTIIWIQELMGGGGRPMFTGQVAFWLWFTVLFANFAEAMAEGRGKAQAATLRKSKAETMATRVRNGSTELVPAGVLRSGDVVRVKAGELIPGDGEIIEGVASVDESAITGRIGAGDSRGRRRSVGGHGRHACPVGLDRRPYYVESRRDVSRPHDRARRRRGPPEDTERDCAQHPAGGPHAGVPAGGGDPVAVRANTRGPRSRCRCWSRSSCV